MLQINTGKLFTRDIERTNKLIGILYSNLRLPYQRDIRTAAGSLRATGSGPADLALVYEIEERIELGPSGPGALVSHTVGPYLDEFAIVTSFGMGGIVAKSEGAVRALTDGRSGSSSYRAPSQYLSRVFEQTVYVSNEEADEFEAFVTQLLALERKSFLGAMRAMRTFNAGIQRIPDDLAQAYTLIVSALETLAQDFDAFVPNWADLEDRKRIALDKALTEVDDIAAAAVRDTLLAHEHVAIGRRYRAYALSHIGSDFYRQVTLSGRPIARYEMEAALRSAYNIRSSSLHQGRPLPDAITIPHNHWETTTVDRRPALTLEGLCRMTRHVIRRFVAMQPKLEVEEYDYSRERYGIIFMEFAPQYWVWKPFTDPADARKRFEGFVSMVCAVLMQEKDAGLVDMRPMLADVERLLPRAARQHRPAMLSLHILFNFMVAPEQRSPGFDAFYDKYSEEVGALETESLVVASLLNADDDWEMEAHATMLKQYFEERVKPSGLHVPRLAEAAMCLTLAEKFRSSGNETRAREYLAQAVESHPGRQELRALEHSFLMTTPVLWREILLPREIELTNGELSGAEAD